MEVLHSSPGHATSSALTPHSSHATVELSKRFVSIATAHMEGSEPKPFSSQAAGHAPCAAATRGMAGPSREEGASSGMSPNTADLDSTGDSDRLVIAEEDGSDAGSAASSPEAARRARDRGVREQAGGTAGGAGTEMELEVHAQTELVTGHKLIAMVKVAKALNEGQELKLAEVRQVCMPQTQEAREVVERQLSPALDTKRNITPTQAAEPETPKAGVPKGDVTESTVADMRVHHSDCRDVDSQSNVSMDSGREHAGPLTSCEYIEKKRRRRKPIKVSKHESDENFGEKLDKNYNSPEAETELEPKPVERLFTPESKPVNQSAGPRSEPKPVSRLMNSFVAKAMKLWYDDELPNTLMSPSKDLSKMVAMADMRPAQVLETKPEPPKEKETPAPKAATPLKETSETEPAQVEMSLICDEPPLGGNDTSYGESETSYGGSLPHHKEYHHSGVAPDDQYYSTPSQVTPDERRAISGVQEYWTPKRSYMPCNENTNSLSHKGELTPVGTPLVAKAMQSLSLPSPAVSPSLASDQESPSAGPKRYFCNLCNKTFTFRTNLTRHQRAFHGRPCRRRTHDSGSKDDLEPHRAHSLSSEDMDSISDRGDFVEEKLVKTEPQMGPNFGRFSPSVVSDAKAGRFSPSMPSPSASHAEPKIVMPPYVAPTSQSQSHDYIVTATREPVACSLCLTTFESQSELNRHEPTCRGIDRTKLYSDASGAIDLSKPKTSFKPEPSPKIIEPESHPHNYKPKFHYNMSEMLPSSNGIIPKPHESSPLHTPFLPHPTAGLHGMPLLPHHLAATGLIPHHLATAAGLPMPFSPEVPGRKTYKCTLCTKKYSSFKSLSKHVGYVHKLNLMGSHQQQQHPSDEENISAMVAMATAEMRHLVKQETVAPPDGALGQFPCKVCGQVFSFVENLRTHYHTVHLGMKEVPRAPSSRDSQSPDIARVGCKTSEWVCDICGQNFASKRNLNRHLSHVHKLDRKRDSLPHGQDGRSTTPVETKPVVLGVPSYPPPTIGHPAVNLSVMKDDATPNQVSRDDIKRVSTHHMQGVLDCAASTENAERKKPPVVLNVPAPTLREHPVKLPPKKAIMEEYQKEAEMKLRLEREHQERLLLEERRARTASPASSEDSGILNLTKPTAPREFTPREFTDRRPEEVQDVRPAVMDLSTPQPGIKELPPIDMSSSGSLGKSEAGKEYFPNPFSAILNLSQTYLRKLLNDTPNPPPHHPDMYSMATIKDKENNIDKDRYGRSMGGYRPNMQGTREYSPDTTTRLRDMLSGKGISVSHQSNNYHSDDSHPGSRNNSLPPSGRSTPVEGIGQYDRRPLVMSSENHDNNGGYIPPPSYSDISPLRMNAANMMALKAKLMDHHNNPGTGSPSQLDWKPKTQKKRKNSDYPVDEVVSNEGHQPEPNTKKPREGASAGGDGTTSVDQIKTGEFPAIAIGKRHICGLCGASFTFQTNLTRHQRKLHGKPFVRKSSQTHVKLEGIKSPHEAGHHDMPLSMVPQVSPAPLTLIKQE